MNKVISFSEVKNKQKPNEHRDYYITSFADVFTKLADTYGFAPKDLAAGVHHLLLSNGGRYNL